MIHYCDTCKLEIVAEDIVVSCDGLCEDQRIFHARCVGLSYDEGCACLHRNVFWMCDSCRDSIEYARFRKVFHEKQENAYATRSELDCLKSEINRISEIISRTVPDPAAVRRQPTSFVNQQLDRFADQKCSPLSSTKLNASDPAVNPDDTNLQLYVSNIAPDVKETDVKRMVCDSIGANDLINVKCLVPSWKNVHTLNFVSFKVTVHAQFRDAALRSSNWPSGVRCRIFKDFSDSVWRPSTSTSQLSLDLH